MYPKYPTKWFAARAAFALLLSVVMLAPLMPVHAADDDDEAIDQKFIRGVLEGLGLERDGKQIDYHERPPLVVPPTRDLPLPEQAGAVVNNNPAWPKDPDIERGKVMKKQERQRTASDESSPEWNHLLPDQLTPGGDPRTRPSGRAINQGPGVGGERLSPSQLGYKGGIFGTLFGRTDEENVQFSGEPARNALTDPPQGYRTPSPDQPYGVGKAGAQKATDYPTAHGTMEK